MGIMGRIKGWKSRPVASYRVEPRDVQARIMRTHIAAMSGEISNLRTMLEVEFSRGQEIRDLLQSISDRLDGVRITR